MRIKGICGIYIIQCPKTRDENTRFEETNTFNHYRRQRLFINMELINGKLKRQSEHNSEKG